MYIKGGVDSPAGPANTIPLSKTVWHCHTTICYALGTGSVSPVFFPGIFLGASTYVRINVCTHQFAKHPQLLAIREILMSVADSLPYHYLQSCAAPVHATCTII